MSLFQDDQGFEDEIRRVARLLWATPTSSGAAIVDGRERDGIFVTNEMVHIIECTTSNRKQKAVEDGRKLANLIKKMRDQREYRFKSFKGWFITLNEPTAEQRQVIAGLNEAVEAIGSTPGNRG